MRIVIDFLCKATKKIPASAGIFLQAEPQSSMTKRKLLSLNPAQLLLVVLNQVHSQHRSLATYQDQIHHGYPLLHPSSGTL